jgi:hypothetical protein
MDLILPLIRVTSPAALSLKTGIYVRPTGQPPLEYKGRKIVNYFQLCRKVDVPGVEKAVAEELAEEEGATTEEEEVQSRSKQINTKLLYFWLTYFFLHYYLNKCIFQYAVSTFN